MEKLIKHFFRIKSICGHLHDQLDLLAFISYQGFAIAISNFAHSWTSFWKTKLPKTFLLYNNW